MECLGSCVVFSRVVRAVGKSIHHTRARCSGVKPLDDEEARAEEQMGGCDTLVEDSERANSERWRRSDRAVDKDSGSSGECQTWCG